MLQLARNLCAPHKAFHKLQLKVLVGLDFCKAHAGVRRRRCNFSETPPPIHLATADKPVVVPAERGPSLVLEKEQQVIPNVSKGQGLTCVHRHPLWQKNVVCDN